MRLVGQIHITVKGDVVKRDPTFLDKLKRTVGARVDLETGELQNQLEATAIVDSVRRALGRLQVGNALSLVIDDTVIFQDTDGKADDLPDLVLALADHSSVFGRNFRELRFAAEHDEAGLHLVIETRARTKHKTDEPAAIISVGGRIRALEPQAGESAEAYRARVEPLTRDAALFEVSRLSFASFVTRLTDAVSAAMPEALVAEHKAEARLIKAPERGVTAPENGPTDPTRPGYDPFLAYYPSPMGVMLDVMLFSSFMHMMMPPAIMVVNPSGAPLGNMNEIQSNPELVSDDRLSGGGLENASYDSHSDYGDTSADEGGGGDDSGGGGWDDGGGFDGGGSFD